MNQNNDNIRYENELEELRQQSGAPAGLLLEAFRQARERGPLDPKTAYLRMRWLLKPADAGAGIELLRRRPQLTAAELADCVIHPKAPLFELIAGASVVDPARLEEIYATMEESSTDPSGLPDLTEERMLQEMKWWIIDLEFPDYYFETTPPEEIAHQILVNRFHEVQGLDSDSFRTMKISYTSPSGTVIHWVHRKMRSIEVEQGIEEDYYRNRTAQDVSVYAHGELSLYIVQKSEPAPDAEEFEASAPESLFTRTKDEGLDRYRRAWEEIRASGSFYIEQSRKESTGEYRVMVGFPSRVINHFMANLSRVMERAGIEVRRKYTVAFGGAHPLVISSFYASAPFPEDLLAQIVDIGLYPDTRLARLTEAGVFTPAEANFIHAMIGYVHTFITAHDPGVAYLEERFPDHSGLRDLFTQVKRRMAKDLYTVDKIADTFSDNPGIAKRLFSLFELKLSPIDTASSEELAAEVERFEGELEELVSSHDTRDIVACGLAFVKNTLRTNFFLPVKTALSFRLDPGFLETSDFGRAPYAVFYLRGRDFTGFHVRFGAIARGGIRILRSATFDAYRANANSLFEECYNLASTQDKKNKDIPEKGAKGIILPHFGRDDPGGRAEAFRKYIDSLLDLLLPEQQERIRGYEQELLFLGPDEGTAELMNWACERARTRGYPFWRAFTTGKSAPLGGISHVDYGMTTNGVHRYVLGILDALGLREEEVTKVQTGGPDGDLGGNEVLISRDRTIAIVDGGGVLYDPEGLDRGELERLARERIDSSNFDRARLGPAGFLVSVGDRNLTLPDGTAVQSGMSFRNGFHLSKWMRADLFVPCGGRPQSITSTNWDHLLDEQGRPRVRWIVEGANLFITQEARLKLEERGVVLFKDSSTNKGGVTSSSYEVLAGLALSDEDFALEMCWEEGELPEFRRRFIDEVIERIKENADAEFALLWRTHGETGRPLSELSDELSLRVLEVTAGIEGSSLFEDEALLSNVLRLHLPSVLLERVGLPALLERVPRPYLEAVFARTIARRFVYEFGLEPSYEDYRLYIDRLRRSEPR